MYKVVITNVRPNVNIAFARYDSDFCDYIEENYIKPGKLLGEKIELLDDKITEIHTMIFGSVDDYNTFSNDPVIRYQQPIRVRYNTFYRIASSKNLSEIEVTKDLYNIYLR
jgi:hypothetical protein